MEINKVQWRMIAKGEKLPCDSFLMRKDGTMTSMVTGAGVVVGQDAYYLPVDELRTLPKEESEDERIRKEILEYFYQFDNKELRGVDISDWIAWLEKQQKPADKVKPKFKVGDWFVKNDGSHINKEYDTCKISKVGNVYYAIESIYGDTGKISFESFDTNFHLWKIQDAKDGDVLADGNLPFIFKKIDSMMHSYAYCGISVDDGFKIESEGESGEWTWMQDIKPATKEQRDTLLKAMTDAGYTFDFEKKELKKIEQKQECSKEDEKMIGNIRRIIEQYAFSQSAVDVNGELCEKEYIDADNWLKSLKDRVQPQPKQEWSEEDFAILDEIIHFHETTLKCLATEERHNESRRWVNWLKSLRPQSQWKPSDEQMEALEHFIVYHNGSTNYAKNLEELRLQLKKLREE